MRGTLYGFYGQDNFKVNPRLTLNLGLRWEPFWPFHDTTGRGGNWRPGVQSERFPLAPKLDFIHFAL
jgi:outer membrane receptor protein involved in Fe transport